MKKYQVHEIGRIQNNQEGAYIILNKEYIEGLKSLQGFSHINVIWWFSELDSEEYRKILQIEQPYKKAPEVMGIFSTRSPIRPNPIALTTVQILNIDEEEGKILIPFIDANDGTPILDIKPYTPSFDRIEHPKVPDWCSHWPMSLEESGTFNWEDEFVY